MNRTRARIVPNLPWLGLLLVVAGAAVTLVTRRFELLNNFLLVGGALLLLLYLVARPHEVRALLRGRQARYGTSSLLAVIFFGAIAVLLYYVAYQNDDWRVDLTESGLFTPPAETVALLQQIEEPVHVIGFYSLGLTEQRETARSLLENLSAYSNNLTYEIVDTEANPLLAQKYELNFDGTLVFVRNRDQADEVFARAAGVSERDIHVALLQVVNPVEKRLYFLTGHGEPAFDSMEAEGLDTAAAILRDQGFSIASLNLLTAPGVPDDAAVLAIVGPRTVFAAEEVAAIRDYLEGGGAVFIARDTIDLQGNMLSADDPLNGYLQESWGIGLRSDVIIDPEYAFAGRTYGLDFIAADYGASPIVTAQLRRTAVAFSIASSLALGGAGADIVHTALVQTGANAWGETDLESLVTASAANADPEDTQGVLNVGVTAENLASGARLAVFGDGDFVANANLGGGNSLLFTNALNWLAADEVTIELAPREQIQRQVNIPGQQLRLLQLVGTWFGPLLMVLVGLFVWTRRRSNV